MSGWVNEKEEEIEEVLNDAEITMQIRKLKKGKVAGKDGIENEAWIFGGVCIKGKAKRND